MLTLSERTERLRDFDLEIAAVKVKRTQFINDLIAECNHPEAACRLLPPKTRYVLGCDPPWLLCTACGLTEEQWGNFMYGGLAHVRYKDLPKVSHDYWLKYSTKRLFGNGDVVYV